jgi:hypothetical protein
MDERTFPGGEPNHASDWPYAPLQPIAADIAALNDQGLRPPLTTLVANTNNGPTVAPPPLALTQCTNANPRFVRQRLLQILNALYPYYAPTAATATNTWNLLDGYCASRSNQAVPMFRYAEWLGQDRAVRYRPTSRLPLLPRTQSIRTLFDLSATRGSQ